VGDPVREDFKTVLALVEHLTVLGGQLRRFTRLEPGARLAYLRGWATSRLALRRAAYFALKGFVQYFAFIEPTTRAVTGYTGPWTERATVAPRPVDFGDIA
ncbi:MAG TPA: hypothetical protein VK864_14260, partial [Longimicrobiales bacterium]|nr:hypothetical protein [Longimicrobiales bacterium]